MGIMLGPIFMSVSHTWRLPFMYWNQQTADYYAGHCNPNITKVRKYRTGLIIFLVALLFCNYIHTDIPQFGTHKKRGKRKTHKSKLLSRSVEFKMNLWGHRFSQNANQKSIRFLPYPLINFQGRNLRNFWLAFWEKQQWPNKFILNLTDL